MQYIEKERRCAVIKIQTRDEQVFAELIRPCQNTLFRAALAITRNREDAMDAVQEGILKGWKKWATLKDDQMFATWMTRIVIHAAIDIIRKRKPTSELFEDGEALETGRDERLDVWRAIEALDQKTRVATVLYYFEDMGVKDIAKALGIRQGTVKSRLFRARETLRHTLEGYRHDE